MCAYITDIVTGKQPHAQEKFEHVMLEPPYGLQTWLPEQDIPQATIPLDMTLLRIFLNR